MRSGSWASSTEPCSPRSNGRGELLSRCVEPPEDGGQLLRARLGPWPPSSTPEARPKDVRSLMPGSSPPPALRRPAPAAHGRYMSNGLEREYAMRAERLEALEQDIRRARKGRPPSLARREPPPAPHGEPARLPDGTRSSSGRSRRGRPGARAGFERLTLLPIPTLSRAGRLPHATDQLDYLTRVDHTRTRPSSRSMRPPGRVSASRVSSATPGIPSVSTSRSSSPTAGTAGASGRCSRAARCPRPEARRHVVHSAHGRRQSRRRRLVERVGQDIREREDGGAIVLAAQPRDHARAGQSR